MNNYTITYNEPLSVTTLGKLEELSMDDQILVLFASNAFDKCSEDLRTFIANRMGISDMTSRNSILEALIRDAESGLLTGVIDDIVDNYELEQD